MKPRVIKAAKPPEAARGPQRVHVARTSSGVPGFFTGTMLAFSLSEEEFLNAAKHANLAKRYGFLLEAL